MEQVMAFSPLKRLVSPIARRLEKGNMRGLGIEPTMRLAQTFNRLRYKRHDRWRRSLYQTELSTLMEENGPTGSQPLEMRDGWAIDTSMTLPHLDRVLEEADRIIAERSGSRWKPAGSYRSYFQDMWHPRDAENYPAFLDFATSSGVVGVISRYLQCIPSLSATAPPGIRLVESNAAFDDKPDRPHDSQLYHLDYYSLPNVYVLVLLRDTSLENGPWTFIPRSVSQRARKELGYWKRGKPYRLSDDEVYSVVDRREVIEFAYPRGTVLFIESSGCLHYGSRNSVAPRFQLMYGYTCPFRSDFSEITMTPYYYPTSDTDSRLRKLVLNKNLLRDRQAWKAHSNARTTQPEPAGVEL
jgi:hypothetical protein